MIAHEDNTYVHPRMENLKSIWSLTQFDLANSPTARAAFMANDLLLSALVLRGIITYHLAAETCKESRSSKKGADEDNPSLFPDPDQTP